MNWYKISKKKKKKNKKKKQTNWVERSKKVTEPYIFDEELGLMYKTPSGTLAWADLIKEIEKISNNNNEITAEVKIKKESGIFDTNMKERIKEIMKFGIPATLIAAMLAIPNMKENYLIKKSSDKWFNDITNIIQSGQRPQLSQGPFREEVKKMIMEHENGMGPSADGLYHAYADGNSVSIGYGFYLGRKDAEFIFKSLLGKDSSEFENIKYGNGGITEDEADKLMNYSFNEAIGIAYRQFSDFAVLSPYLQAVIVDMCYNLGETKIHGFKKFRDSLDKGGKLPYDLDRAMLEMERSKWWDQVGRRSKVLQEIIRKYKETGKNNLNDNETAAFNTYYENYQQWLENNSSSDES